DISTALEGMTYTTSASSDDTLSISVDDPATLVAGQNQATGSVSIAVMQPSVSVPGGQSTTPNATITFSTANANAITVGDSGPSQPTLTVHLADSYGILTLASTTGLTITAGANGSSSLAFTGSSSDINAAMEGL